jgi:phosphotransferase system HPr-like phosphotransfer protein
LVTTTTPLLELVREGRVEIPNKNVSRACSACMAEEIGLVAKGFSSEILLTTRWTPFKPSTLNVKEKSLGAFLLWAASADAGLPLALRARGADAPAAFDAMMRVLTAPSLRCNGTDFAKKVFRGEVPLPPDTDVYNAPAHSADVDVSWCSAVCVVCLYVEILRITRRYSADFRISDENQHVDLRDAMHTIVFLATASRAKLSVRGADAAQAFGDIRRLLNGRDARALVAIGCDWDRTHAAKN